MEVKAHVQVRHRWWHREWVVVLALSVVVAARRARGHLWPAFLHVRELANYVRVHTVPSDRVYAWIGDIESYYAADRPCPIDIIWPLYAEVTGSYRRIFGPQTRYVIVGETLPPTARRGWLPS